jgi:S1-C subfamily serine protease
VREAPEQIPIEENGIVRVNTSVRIGGIFRDWPANRAGLQPGDAMVSLNGVTTRTAADVRAILMAVQTGAKAPVEVLRDRKKLRVMVDLDKRPDRVTAELITGGPSDKSRPAESP